MGLRAATPISWLATPANPSVRRDVIGLETALRSSLSGPRKYFKFNANGVDLEIRSRGTTRLQVVRFCHHMVHHGRDLKSR